MFRSFSTFARAARTARGYATAAGEDFQVSGLFLPPAGGSAYRLGLDRPTEALMVWVDCAQAHRQHVKEHASGAAETWRKVT